MCVEIAPAGAAAQSAAGGETSGSTARSAEREDVAQATPQGNPSPATTLNIKELRQKVVTPFLFPYHCRTKFKNKVLFPTWVGDIKENHL